MYERLESIVLALRRWRALSSNTSLVNKRVTSMMMEGSRPVSLYSLISGRAVLPAASLAAAGFAAPSLAAAASLAESAGDTRGAANAFYAIGQQRAIGYSPFGIDNVARLMGFGPDAPQPTGPQPPPDVEALPFSVAYKTLAQLAPSILEHQAKGT